MDPYFSADLAHTFLSFFVLDDLVLYHKVSRISCKVLAEIGEVRWEKGAACFGTWLCLLAEAVSYRF